VAVESHSMYKNIMIYGLEVSLFDFIKIVV
jgi:hypothetical protein